MFLFTVFGGYSLLLWCQQSLWMIVPPALVLAVLIWTFLKMDDKITALQKRVDELEAAQKTAEKSEKINTTPPLPENLFRQGRRIFMPYFLSGGSSSPSNITMPKFARLAPSAKPTVPSDTLNKAPIATPNRMPADLTFLHLTALPFRTRQRTAAKEGVQPQNDQYNAQQSQWRNALRQKVPGQAVLIGGHAKPHQSRSQPTIR